MARTFLGAVLLAALLSGTASAQAQPRAGVDALLRRGQLDQAERLARAGGPSLAVALGEVWVRRGRLSAADSLFRSVVALRGTDERSARVGIAEIAARRGDHGTVEREAGRIVAEYRRGSVGWSARDHVAAGRAFLLVSRSDAGAVRSALRAFDAGTAADSSLDEAALRAADLLLEKYNGPDAEQSYQAVLERRPGHPWAILGLAWVMDFSGKGDALAKAREALNGDPALTAAHLFIARLHLEAERPDSAEAASRRALAVDPTALEGWAVIGAVAWLAGDSPGFAAARAAAERIAPRPAPFYVMLSDAAARQRRYADAERFAAQALALDSLSVPALGSLGTNRLRSGRIVEGRAHIERAFAIDPFNLWHKNTLDMLDVLDGFRTVDIGRFRFVASAREADILLPYLSPLLEEAYEKLAARYDYRPEPPIRFEIFARHADFSVRTVGLTGLGALGVSFGRVLAIDAPSARDPGSFNWGSTSWHELAHTFTLGLSGNRVPRWFSEGASVFEERRAREGWGAQASASYLAALKSGSLRPVSQLNDGFVRPRAPEEVILSYYHASLVCEMIDTQFGPSALGAMLRGWRDGLSNEDVFKRVLRLDEKELDTRFDAWVKDRFRGATASADGGDSSLDPLLARIAESERTGNDSVLVATLEQVLWIWPYDVATHVKLADAATRLGLHGKAVRERTAVIALGPADLLEARFQLGRALLAAGDRAGARREVLGVLELAPTFEKAQALLLELRRPLPEDRD